MTLPLLSRPLGVRAADLRDPCDADRATAFVRAQPGATPFHLPVWSTAVGTACRQRPHYLVAERADGSIAGVLPLTEMRSALFGKALVSAGFAVDGGVLAEAPGAVEALAAGAWALAEELNIGSVELRGGPLPDGAWHEERGTYLGFSRALAADDEAELLAIPRKQRAEVRKALAGELAVAIGTAPAERAAHYAVYAESVRNLGTPVFPRALFDAVLDGFGADADLLVVRDGETAVAGVLSLYMNGTVYPYWGGGTRAARALRANDAMYFALMRHARERGCTQFDFGRSKAGTGPAAFKKNWGFEGVPMGYAVRTADGAAPRQVNPLSPKYRLQVAAWKRLPLPVANLIGPWLARGLG